VIFVRTLNGNYINVAMVENFHVAERVDGKGWNVCAITGVPDGEEDPFTLYSLYGPYDDELQAQAVLAKMMEQIQGAANGPKLPWRKRLRRLRGALGRRLGRRTG